MCSFLKNFCLLFLCEILISFSYTYHLILCFSYVLGAVFLQLCKLLKLEEHSFVQKPVDPSLFIHRFTESKSILFELWITFISFSYHCKFFVLFLKISSNKQSKDFEFV